MQQMDSILEAEHLPYVSSDSAVSLLDIHKFVRLYYSYMTKFRLAGIFWESPLDKFLSFLYTITHELAFANKRVHHRSALWFYKSKWLAYANSRKKEIPP